MLPWVPAEQTDFLQCGRTRQRGVVTSKILQGRFMCSQASSELPCLTKSPLSALGIPDTGRAHGEDLEPSYRKPQTSRDDRPSLNIQASKQESFPQLNPVKFPEMDVWSGIGWGGT